MASRSACCIQCIRKTTLRDRHSSNSNTFIKRPILLSEEILRALILRGALSIQLFSVPVPRSSVDRLSRLLEVNALFHSSGSSGDDLQHSSPGLYIRRSSHTVGRKSSLQY